MVFNFYLSRITSLFSFLNAMIHDICTVFWTYSVNIEKKKEFIKVLKVYVLLIYSYHIQLII